MGHTLRQGFWIPIPLNTNTEALLTMVTKLQLRRGNVGKVKANEWDIWVVIVERRNLHQVKIY